MLSATVALPRAQTGNTSAGEELAVWQAMTTALAREHATRPFRQLYFRTDFGSASWVSSSMANPDRNDFCGLERDAAEAVMGQLMVLNATSVELDAAIAKRSGMKVGHTKDRTARYLALSRVVFDDASQRAWIAVDLSGGAGGLMRLDKVGGEWSWKARCASWVRPRTI